MPPFIIELSLLLLLALLAGCALGVAARWIWSGHEYEGGAGRGPGR